MKMKMKMNNNDNLGLSLNCPTEEGNWAGSFDRSRISL
jgi:hypothetical protein